MREKLKVAGAFLIGLSVASSVTYAQLGGRGRNVAFVDGTAISPSSVTTTGDITANGDLTVGADNTDSKVCFDGPACVNKIDVTQSNDFMTAWSNNTGVWTATPSFFYVYKQLMAQQPVVSLMASGSQSFSCANLGCRLNLGSTARYLTDDGTNLEFVAPVQGTSFEALATSGSSFTGGNSSSSLTITSNTPDSVTSSTVPAIRLQASENIGNTDLLMSVEDSAGNRRMTLTESGGLVISGSLSPGDVANLNLAGYFSPNPRSITIASDGAGTPAAYTLALGFNRTLTFITCNDSDGCDITISNAAPVAGYHEIVNVSANNVTFTDTAGVSEMAGNFTAGQYDVIKFVAVTDRYVEVSRSDN